MDMQWYRKMCEDPLPEAQALLKRLTMMQPAHEEHKDFQHHFILMVRGILRELAEEYEIAQDLAKSHPDHSMYAWRFLGVHIGLVKTVGKVREQLDGLEACEEGEISFP